MAAGQFASGLGLAGSDPVVGAARADLPTSNLPYVNGETLDWEVDDDGQYLLEHPIDTTVFLRMRAAVGWIRCSPETGNRIPSIQYLDQSSETRAAGYIRSALSDLVTNRDIRIESIQIVQNSPRGRLMAALDYRNLRNVKDKRPKRVSVDI